mgnify:CR=1 FL=1
MDRRFMGKSDGFPSLGAIRWRQLIKNRSTVCCIAGIPAGAHGKFTLPVAINIAGGEANIVFWREMFGDDMFLPGRILVPLNRGFIR